MALLRSVQGLIAASFAAVALAYVGEALPPRWRSTGIGAVSTAFLVAGILGQVYAQAVAQALGWRWVIGLAVPARSRRDRDGNHPDRAAPQQASQQLGQKYRELGALAKRRELALPFMACATVLLSFVAMYAALGPLLRARFGLDDTGLLLVRLAALPAIMLAPLAGWLVGRFGPVRICVGGFLLAATGLALKPLPWMCCGCWSSPAWSSSPGSPQWCPRSLG